MIQVEFILKNKDIVINKLRKRGFDSLNIIDDIIKVSLERKKIQTLLDNKRNELNTLSKEISTNLNSIDKLKNNLSTIKSEIKNLELSFKNIKDKEAKLLIKLPNLPHDSVPEGKNSNDNKVIYENNVSKKIYNESFVSHTVIADKFNIIDFANGTKITGSGFPILKGKGAKLERALINFFLDEAIKNGYEEIIPPFIVNHDSAFATGQLPDKDEQMYYIQNDNFYLIPTSEVPITNIYRNEILKESDFPIKLTAYSPCFRREAGSYGSTVKGLNRVHQFNKVEIVQIVNPKESYKVLEEMCKHVDTLLNKLGLHYRLLQLCAQDLGFASATTYDFEVYSPGQKMWLEVSSVSNFESFQSNRLKLRYKDNNQKIHLAHTLNGSALALPRIIVAILEQYQYQDKIIVPEVLVPFTGFKYID